MKVHDVIVIGGGISGLSAAWKLAGSGRDVVVLERAQRPGGKAVSERIGGFLMEHGPSTLNAAVPEAEEVSQALSLADARIDLGAGVRKRYLRDGDRLYGISVNHAGFLLSNYLPIRARLSILLEAVRPRRTEAGDESIFDFTARRFGRGFAERVMEPMVGGIYMGDGHALSLRAVFPRLADLEERFGSVIRGMMCTRHGRGDPGRRLFSWREGIATLPDRLARDLGRRVHTGVAVTKLRTTTGAGFELDTPQGRLRARVVVLAVQPHVAAALLERIDPVGAEAAAAIAAPPAAVVFAGYRRRDVAHPLDGLGYLPTRGSGLVSGVQFCSTMFSQRAPEGHVALSAYVGGARAPDLARLPADQLAACVHAELARVLGIKGASVVSRVRHWPVGLPQYAIGHEGRRQILESAAERLPGLYLAGNFLRGVSVASCVASGWTVAERANAQLASPRGAECDGAPEQSGEGDRAR